MAIPFFHHWPVSKHKQEKPGTAVANLRYNTRIAATHYVGAGGGLSTNYQHIKRVLEEREVRIRKDGRITENFVFALPRELDLDHQIWAVERFGFRLTKGGQAPFYFSIHWEENNPHCHFVLIDQHRETGRTVAKAWERNSTHRFKRLWADVANDDMAALGIDARIDFDAAEQKAQALREEQANDNDIAAPPDQLDVAPISTDMEVEPDLESGDDDLLETEDADDGDDDMAYLNLPGEPLENVFDAHRELEILHAAQAELARVKGEFGRAVDELEIAAREAGHANQANEFAKQAVGPAYDEYRSSLTAKGKLKGLAIGIGRWQWKSQTRRRAEEAALSYHGLRSRQEETAKALRDHEDQVTRWENAKADYQRREQALNNQLRRYSSGKNQDYAEKLFQNTIRKNMEKVPLDKLQEAYERGEINEARYREVLYIIGAHHELEELDDERVAKNDRSEGY